ncbi:procollagen-lysine,2-oxoglutarate 5-dioxygenase 2-like [Homarus americanus]|uniref:procollagen-lysine,2-oxoglutarate 5-dioxygenase 2-like n=1 Tax=Homarus americanus TaxID=6706 RepID=UPI001C46E3E7|nr:procollagen-lysine,2-oxoglutarate 5-dioxygenase 2-like [Homarus americanus]
MRSLHVYGLTVKNGSDINCEDPFHPALSTYAENCQVPKERHIGQFPANFCVKIIGTSAARGESLMIRTCVLENMDSQCGVFKFGGEQLTGCILTCKHDGFYLYSYDAIFTAGKEVILERFDNLDARVVFAAEDFCWPDKTLASQYPRVFFGYKYLNSGGIIAYAPELYKITSLYKIENNDDDQLYFTKIFVDKNKRDEFKMKLDTQANIFQNLNGQLGCGNGSRHAGTSEQHCMHDKAQLPGTFKPGDVSLKFEDDDVKIINTVYQSTPVVIHGNGPSKIQLNSLGNYLAKSWTQASGCLACQEDLIDMKNLSVDDYPHVLIAVFVENPVPFLEEMLAKVTSLNYPKHRIDLLVHNQAELHEELVKAWVAQLKSSGYRSIKFISVEDNMKEWHARNLAVELCLRNSCDAFFSIDGDVHLDNPDTLSLLLKYNRPVLAAVVIREGQAWSTFWGAINAEGFYARSIDYMDIVQNNRRSVIILLTLLENYYVEAVNILYCTVLIYYTKHFQDLQLIQEFFRLNRMLFVFVFL